MASAVILVRHAMPEVEPGVSSKFWRLGEHAKEDCVLLAHALPEALVPTVYSSDQPKTAETAAIIALRRGLKTAADARFAEVDQSAAGWLEGDYRAVGASYLVTGESPGWESRESVVRRFEAAVESALAGSPEPGDFVVVTHGLAMSLWLASRTTIELPGWWRELTFPDAWRLDLQSGELTRLFNAGMAPE